MIRFGDIEIVPPFYWQLGIDNPEMFMFDWGQRHRDFRGNVLNLSISSYCHLIGDATGRKPDASTIYKWEHGLRLPDPGYRDGIAKLVLEAAEKQSRFVSLDTVDRLLELERRIEALEKKTAS